jgi:predicted porin
VTSSIGNGSSFVGASGGFGAIKLGAPNIATLAINGDGNSGFATAVGSGYRVSSFDAVRFQNSLRYDTPTMGGFAASMVYSPKNDKQSATATNGSAGLSGNFNNQTRGRDDVTEIGVSYAAGPLSVRAAQLKMKQWADVASTLDPYNTISWINTTGAGFTLTSLSAAYTVNPTLSVAYFRQDVSSDALVVQNSSAAASTSKFDRTTNGVSARFLATPTTTLRVNYQKASNGANHSAAGATTAANLSTTVLGLGADYALSKRTSVYARYEKNDDKAGMRAITGYTGATGNTTYTATAIGLRHSF